VYNTHITIFYTVAVKYGGFMSNEIAHERVVETDVVGDQVVQRESVDRTNPDHVRRMNKIIQIVYYIEGIIMAILGLRFILRLFGASTASTFVAFIYMLSYPFVAPFFGMFRTTWGYGAARLEFETLISIVVYAILVWIIVGLVRIGKS
jgi:hypothetical protein